LNDANEKTGHRLVGEIPTPETEFRPHDIDTQSLNATLLHSPYKQMLKYCTSSAGSREWTKEEMMTYLD
jgi:hypothetical protein